VDRNKLEQKSETDEEIYTAESVYESVLIATGISKDTMWRWIDRGRDLDFDISKKVVYPPARGKKELVREVSYFSSSRKTRILRAMVHQKEKRNSDIKELLGDDGNTDWFINKMANLVDVYTNMETARKRSATNKDRVKAKKIMEATQDLAALLSDAPVRLDGWIVHGLFAHRGVITDINSMDLLDTLEDVTIGLEDHLKNTPKLTDRQQTLPSRHWLIIKIIEDYEEIFGKKLWPNRGVNRRSKFEEVAYLVLKEAGVNPNTSTSNWIKQALAAREENEKNSV
jgi:hypothetical protein